MRYLTTHEILVMHKMVVDATGGSHGVRDVGLLISASERPKGQFGGEELYRDVFVKAAVYLHALVLHHVFVDGNKRIAIITAARFLFLNAYQLTATNKEIERFVLSVITEKSEIETIAQWLKKHTKKV
ncbi:MAG: type II toxin-antitoxin system death-on-curing family toxin [bacterium]|nr:type II toxin-antitoxin system death-on-curing family toxin [bacterium]